MDNDLICILKYPRWGGKTGRHKNLWQMYGKYGMFFAVSDDERNSIMVIKVNMLYGNVVT